MTSPDDQRPALSRAMDFLRRTGTAAKDGVQRTYEVATLKIDIASLRRSLEEVTREIGRRTIDEMRASGQVGRDALASQLRRVDELEALIAEKERLIADIEREEEAGASDAPRRRPAFGTRPPGDDSSAP